uniref:CSON007754 protein n=1 Tax=Culicoides sonorensis TaxID=179676 RepID=A0A336MUM6_CULSO
MDSCRICLQESSLSKSLFAETNCLADRINEVFNFEFKITQSEDDPCKICIDCMTDLHHALTFYDNAKAAEQQLALQRDELRVEDDLENEDTTNESELVEEVYSQEEYVHFIEEGEILIEEDKTNLVYIQDDDADPDDSNSDHQNTLIIKNLPKKSDSTILFKCDICSKTYDKKASYQYHMKTKHVATDDRKFECNVCQKKFAFKHEIIRHSRIHTNDKPFSCSVCGKKFTDRSTHLKHEKIHAGVKEHQCDQCPKSFLHKFALDNHYLTHTGEKNFICPNCRKCFARKSKLKDHFYRKHKRIYTKEDEERSRLLLEKLQENNEEIEESNYTSVNQDYMDEFCDEAKIKGEILNKIADLI